jgi:hypothetical protein
VAGVSVTGLLAADFDQDKLDRRLRWVFVGVLALLVAYLVYLSLWPVGDYKTLGGRTAPVPSVADGFYICFFLLAYISYTMVIRRGTRTPLLATSLDAVVAGLAAASVAAAFAFSAVMKASGGGNLSTATNLLAASTSCSPTG